MVKMFLYICIKKANGISLDWLTNRCEHCFRNSISSVTERK